MRTDTITVYTVTRLCCLDAPAPLSAVSRKSHAGADRDIDLLAGSRVECRRGGTGDTHRLVVTFPTAVTVGGVTVMSSNGLATATQSTTGAVVTIDVSNVANDQTATVTLTNVSDGTDTGNVPILFPVLLGDTNGDRTVNSGDLTQTKGRSGQTATAAFFRSDVNVDGVINVGDSIIVRSRSGTTLND